MNYILWCQVSQAIEHISNDIADLFLLKFQPLLVSILKVSLIAQLRNDVAIMITCEDLIAFEDVGVVHVFEDFYFREEEFF